MILAALTLMSFAQATPPGRGLSNNGSVLDNILGVHAGDPFDEALEKLEKLSEPSKDSDKDDDQSAFVPKGTAFKIVVLHGSHEKVSWISAYTRDPGGVPFEKLGDTTKGKVTQSLAT